jgi:ubiquitin C-terminal hydrolase
MDMWLSRYIPYTAIMRTKSMLVQLFSSIYSSLLLLKGSRRKIQFSRRGLVNLGNTCFLNCVLQCLVTPYFLEHLKDISQHYPQSHDDEPCFSRDLLHLLQELKEEQEVGEYTNESPVVNPRRVLDSLKSYQKWIAAGEQEDAYEALELILSIVETEAEAWRKSEGGMLLNFALRDRPLLSAAQWRNSAPGVFDYGGSGRDVNKEEEEKEDGEEKECDGQSPFRSLVAYSMQCQSCGRYRAKTQEACKVMSLPLSAPNPNHVPNRAGAGAGAGVYRKSAGSGAVNRTLSECMHAAFAPEVLHDVYCDACTAERVRVYIAEKAGPAAAAMARQPEVLRMGVLGGKRGRMETEAVSASSGGGSGDASDSFLHESHFESTEMKLFLEAIGLPRAATTAVRTLSMQTLPNILALHLKRFSFSMVTGESTKLTHRVAFPFSFSLDRTGAMHNYANTATATECECESESERESAVSACAHYELSSVLVHASSSDSVHYGHFLCCVREGEGGGRWLAISDREVWQLSQEQVAGASAFMLFYTKAKKEKGKGV